MRPPALGKVIASATEVQAGSMVTQLERRSTPVGASVVASAVGRRVVGWDDPVVRHLPGFRLKRRDTTRNVVLALVYRFARRDRGGRA